MRQLYRCAGSKESGGLRQATVDDIADSVIAIITARKEIALLPNWMCARTPSCDSMRASPSALPWARNVLAALSWFASIDEVFRLFKHVRDCGHKICHDLVIIDSALVFVIALKDDLSFCSVRRRRG